MKKELNFLLVDNDPLNNLLSKVIIQHMEWNSEITDFTNPEEALEYMQTTYHRDNDDKKTIVFLDLIMPEMDGWEFIEKFQTLPDEVQEHFQTYILTSSLDINDYQRASVIPLIKGFLEKPLKNEFLQKLYANSSIG